MFSQRAQQEAGKRKDIRELLKPILEEFQGQCVKKMKEDIDQCIGELEANEMNLLSFSGLKLQFICKFVTPGLFSGSGCPVEVDEARVKKVEQSAKFQASSDVERYAEKIAQKIYEKKPNSVIVSLSLRGDLWKQSWLTVTTASGETLQFVTKTIINRTRYGDRFFQFPTRVHKEGA